jgi:hypothetical protein
MKKSILFSVLGAVAIASVAFAADNYFYYSRNDFNYNSYNDNKVTSIDFAKNGEENLSVQYVRNADGTTDTIPMSATDAVIVAQNDSDLWQGNVACTWSNNHFIKIGGGEPAFANLKSGDIIEFAVSATESGTTPQMQFLKADWTTPLECVAGSGNNYVDLPSGQTTYDIKLTAADAAYIIANGFNIKGNNVTFTSMKIVAPSTSNVIWQGNEDWTSGSMDTWITIDPNNLVVQSLEAGDELVFYFTESQATTYWQIFAYLGGWSTGFNGETNPQLDMKSGQTSYAITLTSADVNTLKTKGAYIKGKYLTLTKITKGADTGGGTGGGGSTTGDVYWEGTKDMGEWAETGIIQIAPDVKFNSLKAGDVMEFDYTCDATKTYWQIKPTYMDWSTLLGGKTTSQIDVSGTSYSLTLTAADVTEIQKNGFAVKGYGVTMTKICKGTAMAAGNIWEGTTDFGTDWSKYVKLDGDAFANVAEGTVLTFNFAEGTTDYWQIKWTKADWSSIFDCEKTLVNTYNCIDMTSGQTSQSVTLTAADATALKASGCAIKGYGLTLKSISYK